MASYLYLYFTKQIGVFNDVSSYIGKIILRVAPVKIGLAAPG